jgi:hypothetical protein
VGLYLLGLVYATEPAKVPRQPSAEELRREEEERKEEALRRARELIKRWREDEKRLARLQQELEELERQGKITRKEMDRRFTDELLDCQGKLIRHIVDVVIAPEVLAEFILANPPPNDVRFNLMDVALLWALTKPNVALACIMLLDDLNIVVAEQAEEFVCRLADTKEKSLREADRDYIIKMKYEGKPLSEKYVNLRFKQDPHHLLNCFAIAYLTDDKDQERRSHALGVAKNMEIYFCRQAYGPFELVGQERKVAQRELRWLWHNVPYWWARRYVVEMIGRDLRLAYEGFVEDLVKEQHAYVAKPGENLLKRLRKRSPGN